MKQIEIKQNAINWLDITNPTKDKLEQVAKDFNLPKKILLNCLDPDYLPHLENYGDVKFLILRLMEPVSTMRADTVQELTTKVALFFNDEMVISVHRLPLREVEEVEKKVKAIGKESASKSYVISFFFEQISLGFNSPLTQLEHNLEKFEEQMFESKRTKSLLLEGYYIKRKASAFKKVLKLTIDALSKVMLTADCPTGMLQETKDRLERNLFYAEEVFENMQSLLNLHMSIESQKTNEASFRTNEIMRVLTVLSIFFLPLNFLAGVFGMNFEHIPLLKDPAGFWISVGAMIIISAAISTYVFKKGWLLDRPVLKIIEHPKEPLNESH